MHPNDTSNTEIPYGYCHCGCGQKTRIVSASNASRGLKRGQPLRYINGHNDVHMNRAELFWSKVDKTGGDDACWLWTGATNNDGYGNITWLGRADKAHRVSYRLAFGDIPEHLIVMHSCDTRNCVNPAHLSLGTHQDNSDDKITKGRTAWARGESNGFSKLTQSQVDEIRRIFAEGQLSQQKIANLFNVTRTNVGYIVRGTAWKERKG